MITLPSFKTMSGISFFVYAIQYSEASGGSIVLQVLAELLELLCEDVFIVVEADAPRPKFVRVISVDLAKQLIQQNPRSVAIYPEIIPTNPLNAVHVCRWLLNAPGVMGYQRADGVIDHFKSFQPEGVQFLYSGLCDSRGQGSAGRGSMPILTVIRAKKSIYCDPSSHRPSASRSKILYTVRKGLSKLPFMPPRPEWEELSIDPGMPFDLCMRQQFSEAKFFVSYDHASFLVVLAAMCGCIPIVIPDPRLTADQWRRNTGLQVGVAYGFDASEIAHAASTLNQVVDHLGRLEDYSLKSLLDFLNFWNQHLGLGPKYPNPELACATLAPIVKSYLDHSAQVALLMQSSQSLHRR